MIGRSIEVRASREALVSAFRPCHALGVSRIEEHVIEFDPDGDQAPTLLVQTGACHRIIIVTPTYSDLHFAVVSRSGGLRLKQVEVAVALPKGTTPVQLDEQGRVLVERIPAGDYEVEIQLGRRRERCLIPTTPPGTQPLLIPVAFPLEGI